MTNITCSPNLNVMLFMPDLAWCTRNKNPCFNGGSCLNRKSDTNFNYTCVCPRGFSGTHCERTISNCSLNSCSNGGTCQVNMALLLRVQCAKNIDDFTCRATAPCAPVQRGFTAHCASSTRPLVLTSPVRTAAAALKTPKHRAFTVSARTDGRGAIAT